MSPTTTSKIHVHTQARPHLARIPTALLCPEVLPMSGHMVLLCLLLGRTHVLMDQTSKLDQCSTQRVWRALDLHNPPRFPRMQANITSSLLAWRTFSLPSFDSRMDWFSLSVNIIGNTQSERRTIFSKYTVFDVDFQNESEIIYY